MKKKLMIPNDLTEETKSNENYSIWDENCYKGQPPGKPPTPVTPKMLIKTLKTLKKYSFKGLFFTPKEVVCELLKKHPNVEQDFEILFLEVSDKLACAAAAGLIQTKHDLGYCAHDFRQGGTYADSRSELMFWVLYKKLLNRKLDGRERQKEDRGLTNHISDEKIAKKKKKVVYVFGR